MNKIEGSGWDYGTNLAYFKELVTYWQTKFDWREQERKLNRIRREVSHLVRLGRGRRGAVHQGRC